MKVLITGASGFVGSNLQPFLEREGYSTVGVSLKNQASSDLHNDIEAIVHLAGKAHDTQNLSDPEVYFEINTKLTKKVFAQFLNGNAKIFIYFSSVKAVADTVEGRLFENVISAAKTPYGQSKWQAEQFINSVDLPEGKRVYILRPCMIHGPGNKGNLSLLYQLVSKGIPWPLAAFENKRSFLSISNLQFVIKKILDDPDIPGGIYNLADDEALSTNELIGTIGEFTAKKPAMWPIPRGLIQKIARAGDLIRLPLNSERLKKLTENFEVDNNKIKKALGIEKFPISAREGLKDTLRSLRE